MSQLMNHLRRTLDQQQQQQRSRVPTNPSVPTPTPTSVQPIQSVTAAAAPPTTDTSTKSTGSIDISALPAADLHSVHSYKSQSSSESELRPMTQPHLLQQPQQPSQSSTRDRSLIRQTGHSFIQQQADHAAAAVSPEPMATESHGQSQLQSMFSTVRGGPALVRPSVRPNTFRRQIDSDEEQEDSRGMSVDMELEDEDEEDHLQELDASASESDELPESDGRMDAEEVVTVDSGRLMSPSAFAPAPSSSVASDSMDDVSVGRSPSSLALGLRQQRQLQLQQQLRMSRIEARDGERVVPQQPSIWMSVYRPTQTSKIGVAYYSLNDETLYGGEFMELAAVNQLKYKIQPDLIITTVGQQDRLYQSLVENELDISKPYLVRVMKRNDFTIESAIQRLRLLHIEELTNQVQAEMRAMTKIEHTLLLKSVIDFQQTTMVCALGGLILYLLQSAVFSQLEHQRLLEPIYVRSIQSIPTADILSVDLVTLESLSIFVQESHPGHAARSKEGFSVYSVLNQTKTPIGARLLKLWLQEPITDLKRIQQRQDHVEYFTLDENTDLVGELRTNLRHVKDMTRLLTHFQQKPAGTLQDWRTFVTSLRHLLTISRLISDRRDDLPLFDTLTQLFTRDLTRLLERIDEVIQLDQEEEEKVPCVHVKAGIDRTLDANRIAYANLDFELSEIASDDKVRFRAALSPEVLLSYELLYLPQIGFLARLSLSNEIHDAAVEAGFEFKFKTDTHIYYKNETCHELDERYGDIQGLITDTEYTYIRRIQEEILDQDETIRELSMKVAELDCYLSLAIAAVQNQLVRPHMTEDAVLIIKHGRHLLQEKRIEGFVPNSTTLGTVKGLSEGSSAGSETEESSESKSEQSRFGGGLIHIITGPNNSGKSVYLKQIGIIAYLAHVGSFVPASEATVGICDAILTRIKGIDSINSNFSTFTYDTSQMSYMLRHCTARSLCLIDEYGKGTANLDGIALLAGVVHHLEHLDADCPKTLIATHFHELYSLKLVQESPFVTFWKMDFLETEGSESYGLEGSSSSSPTNSSIAAQGRQRRQKLEPESRGSKHQLHENGPQHLPTIQYLLAKDRQTTSRRLSAFAIRDSLAVLSCSVSLSYKLVPGLSKRSYGTYCAVAAGVPEPLMIRATQVANQIAAGLEIDSIDLGRDSILDPSTSTSDSNSLPISFSTEQEGRWFEFLAFVLDATQLIQSDSSTTDPHMKRVQLADDIRMGLIDADELIGRLPHEQLTRLHQQFLEQLKETDQTLEEDKAEEHKSQQELDLVN